MNKHIIWILHQTPLFGRCLILGVGTWLILNGAQAFYLIRDQLS